MKSHFLAHKTFIYVVYLLQRKQPQIYLTLSDLTAQNRILDCTLWTLDCI